MQRRLNKAERQLLKLQKYNSQLRNELKMQRIHVSEASNSLIEYCSNTRDYKVPSVWGKPQTDPFVDENNTIPRLYQFPKNNKNYETTADWLYEVK
ncbi:hypothetical protein BB558_003032 [Smittium angustum]|uniref:Guanine nucleotide-binding protein subunit gamma n=1 Tax=Smittium angustum TaxID=133377 RepID=A0A2U1IXC7_SMIAN|nr:hypothetical protein BB558_006572 [Smittium angustum]PWA00905.1 hypothetical protein BB558_003032 [Smittium angustum]